MESVTELLFFSMVIDNHSTDFNDMETTTPLPDTILGIPSTTLLLILSVAVIAWLLTKRVEEFSGARPFVTDVEYVQDIRNAASYVGPYIGEIYLYLRAKYYAEGKTGPMFQPGSISDPTLADPLLPIARAQIKSWIDSNRLRIRNKFGADFSSKMEPLWDLSYVERNGGVLEVVYVENGKRSVYFI